MVKYNYFIYKYTVMSKIEIGTLAHAFRTEMSQVIHWALILATSAVIWLELLQVNASYLIK